MLFWTSRTAVLAAAAATLCFADCASGTKEHRSPHGEVSICKIAQVFPCKYKKCGGDASAHILEKATIPNTCVQLHMWNSGIGDEGALAMAKELETGGHAKKLHELDLRYNKITDVGMIAIAKALQTHPGKLTYLALNGNTFGDAAIFELAKIIETAPFFHSLHVENVKFTQEGGKALAKAVEGNIRMQHVWVRHTGVGEEVEASIAASLAKNKAADYGRHSHDEI
eukprot:gene3404-7283_t